MDIPVLIKFKKKWGQWDKGDVTRLEPTLMQRLVEANIAVPHQRARQPRTDAAAREKAEAAAKEKAEAEKAEAEAKEKEAAALDTNAASGAPKKRATKVETAAKAKAK